MVLDICIAHPLLRHGEAKVMSGEPQARGFTESVLGTWSYAWSTSQGESLWAAAEEVRVIVQMTSGKIET